MVKRDEEKEEKKVETRTVVMLFAIGHGLVSLWSISIKNVNEQERQGSIICTLIS